MLRKLFFLALFFMVCNGFSQNNTFSFASKGARENLLIKLKDSIIKTGADNFLKDKKSINWNSYAWATTFLIDDAEQNYAVVKKALDNYKSLSNQDLTAVFEILFACFPNQFVNEVSKTVKVDDEKIFALSVNYLSKNNAPVDVILETRFPKSNHPVITALKNQFSEMHKPLTFEELVDLVIYNKSKNRKVLYSVQHSNRDLVGKAFIQYEDGSFAKDNEGKIILIDQLARSATNMPNYITNGNTPIGVLKIQSLGKSENSFIGPTLGFTTFLPFECSSTEFFGSKKKNFTKENYLSFFPKSMRDNLSLLQTFFAGKAGRGEIHFHGTTIDANLYKNKGFYPHTPSLGCLCTMEIWDENGNLLKSNQQKLVDLWLKTSNESGYAYVVELGENDWKNFEDKLNKNNNRTK